MKVIIVIRVIIAACMERVFMSLFDSAQGFMALRL